MDVTGQAVQSENVAETAIESPTKPLYAIQRPWIVGFLTAATFGIYLVFFMYIYARDLKRLGEKTHPWLWVFAPLIPLAMPFACTNLAGGYTTIGNRIGTEVKISGMGYGLIALLLLLANRGAERLFIEMIGLVMLVTLPLLGFCFAHFTSEINRVKQAMPQIWFKHKPFSITPGCWVWLGVAVFVAIPLLIFVAVEEARHLSREKLHPGQTWTAPDKRFLVTPRTTWSIADKGTFSDGTAEAEFSYSDSVYAIVFDMTSSNVLQNLGDLRRADFLENTDENGECNEQRWLEPQTMVRRAQLVCTGTILASEVTMISTLISTDNNAIEVWGEAFRGPGEEDVSIHLRQFMTDIKLEATE